MLLPSPNAKSFSASVLLFPLSLTFSLGGITATFAAGHESDFEVFLGQRLFLIGDSITKGFGFGNYTNPSPLRTVYGIMTILLKENQRGAPGMDPLAIADSLGADIASWKLGELLRRFHHPENGGDVKAV